MQLTNNFNIREFETAPSAKRLGLGADINKIPEKYLQNVQVLAEQLQVLRDEFDLPIVVTSGYRSHIYNKGVGGVQTSQHLTARAADIQIKGVDPIQIAKTIEKLITFSQMKQGGVGVYNTFVHYDTRGERARWFG